MKFSQIQGNEQVVKALAGAVDSGRLPHALLLHENDGGGAFPMALAFLQYLYCSDRKDGDSCGECPHCNKISKLIHPDVHFVFPVVLPSSSAQSEHSPSEQFIPDFRTLALEKPVFTEGDLYRALGFDGKNPVIGVAEANALLRAFSLHSLEGGYSTALVYLPERMNTQAANKLLKMLEEPPAQTVFVLITHAPEKLLPTIVSRCQMFRISSPLVSAAESYDDGGLLSQLMDALLSRNLSETLSIGEQIAALPSRESAKGFCRYAAEKFRRVFLYQQGLSKLAGDDPEAAAWASKLSKRFPRMALAKLDRTVGMIDRNVNIKILFTELTDSLYMYI